MQSHIIIYVWVVCFCDFTAGVCGYSDVMKVPNNQNDFHLFDLTFLIRGSINLKKTHASDWVFCIQKSFFRRFKQKYLFTVRHLRGSVSCGVCNVVNQVEFFSEFVKNAPCWWKKRCQWTWASNNGTFLEFMLTFWPFSVFFDVLKLLLTFFYHFYWVNVEGTYIRLSSLPKGTLMVPNPVTVLKIHKSLYPKLIIKYSQRKKDNSCLMCCYWLFQKVTQTWINK